MMKKTIWMHILAAALIAAGLCGIMVLSASADESYSLYVGGVQVTDQNASDILGNGTASYDPATKTLTLNGADITEYHTAPLNDEESYYGIYTEVDGLTVCLVGNNKIRIKDPTDTDTASGIYSKKSLTVSGTGKLDVSCWSGILTESDLLIKDCELSFSTLGLTCLMGDLILDGATLSASHSLAMIPSGDIIVRNTTVTEGGIGSTFYAEAGDILVEDSAITASTTEEGMCLITGEGGGSITIRNTVLDLRTSLMAIYTVFGKISLEGVSGSIRAYGETSYGVYGTGGLTMKDCELEITCAATDDSSGCVVSMADLHIQSSQLKLDARGLREVALAIGNPMGIGDVLIEDSEMVINVAGKTATGIAGNNVRLIRCKTGITAAANPDGDGYGGGLVSGNGLVSVNGGMLDVTATGPASAEKPSCGILTDNPIPGALIINADILLRGNQAISSMPDLSQFDKQQAITAYSDLSQSTPLEFNEENLAAIRYLHIHPLFLITFDANGGTGDTLTVADHYGPLTLPENPYTAPEGKLFKGWSLTADGEIITEETVTPLEDLTIYAVWEDVIVETEPVTEPVTEPSTTHTHRFGEEWITDEDQHYKSCECGERQYAGAHMDSNENGSCDVCGMKLTEESGCASVIGSVSAAVVGILTICALAVTKKKED